MPKSGQTGKHRSLNNVKFLQVIQAVTAREGEAEFDSPETVKNRKKRPARYLNNTKCDRTSVFSLLLYGSNFNFPCFD